MISLTLTISPSVKVKGAKAPESPWQGWVKVMRDRSRVSRGAVQFYRREAATRRLDAVGLSVVSVYLMEKGVMRPEDCIISYKRAMAAEAAKRK